MIFPMYILKDRVYKLESQHKNMKTKTEHIEQERSKLYGFIYDMKLALAELIAATDDSTYRDYIDFLSARLKEASECEEATELINTLSLIINRFNNIDFGVQFTYYELTDGYRSYNSHKYINGDYIRSIADGLDTQGRKFNIFDTSCGKGELLEIFKEKPLAQTYGLELENYKAEDAKKHATKIIKGVVRGSRIKNEAFDVLIANCPIKYELTDNMLNGSILKEEKQFLQSTLKYLNFGGIAIIGIPHYRMHKDLCSSLSRQLEDAIVVKGIGGINDKLKMIYICGKKSANKNMDEEFYNKLRSCYDYNNIDSIFNIQMPKYKLIGNYVNVDLFKGSLLDMDELFEIVEISGAMDSFFDKQKVDKISENTKQPLLPFNVGQIGLVLTSGCLDGIVDEGDGYCHLVKGRVSKKSETQREVSTGVVQETEVVSNRVEINVILPNGEFKTLA